MRISDWSSDVCSSDLQWLEFVVTGKARTAIRHQLKHLEHEDAVRLGHRMLDRALEERGSSLERLPAPRLDAYLGELRYPRLEELLADRSEEHTSELQSLMRISYAVFCLTTKNTN